MDWSLLKSFLAVADAASLSAAAQKTGISQPTLGRHITELEHETGTTLFVRGRDGMVPTEAALDLLDIARSVSEQVSRFELKAQGRAAKPGGVVRLTASDIVSTYILPGEIAAMASELPEIEIELLVSNEVQNLLARDADIAIRMVKPTQNDVIAVKVNRMEMGAYATRAYLNQAGIPKTIDDLLGHRMVGYDRSTLILDQMKHIGVAGDRSLFQIRTDDQVAYWELVAAGAGIGFGPNFIARKNPDMVRLLPSLQIQPLEIWLASHQDLRTSPRIRRAMTFLRERLASLDLS